MPWAARTIHCTVHTETQTCFQTPSKEEEECFACRWRKNQKMGRACRRWRERKEKLGAINANADFACLTNFSCCYYTGSVRWFVGCGVTHPSFFCDGIRFGFGRSNTRFISFFLRSLFLFMIAVVVVLFHCRNLIGRFQRKCTSEWPNSSDRIGVNYGSVCSVRFVHVWMQLNWIAWDFVEFKSHWFYCNFISFFAIFWMHHCLMWLFFCLRGFNLLAKWCTKITYIMISNWKM